MLVDELINVIRNQGRRYGKSIELERDNIKLTLTELPSMGYIMLEAKGNNCSWYYSKSSEVTTSEMVLSNGDVENLIL